MYFLLAKNKNKKHHSQKELKELVTSQVAHKCFSISIGLGNSGEQLKEIQENSEQNPDKDKPFILDTLCQVLRSIEAEEKSLAKKLEG